MPKWAQTCGKILSIVGLEPKTEVYGADALPSELQLQLINLYIIAERHRDAAMRFTANKNVALSASAIAA